MSRPSVVLLGFLNTKAAEYLFVHELLANLNVDVVLIDTSIKADAPNYTKTVAHTPKEVVSQAGETMDELRDMPRSEALKVMTRGALHLVKELEGQGRVHGILGLGGSTSTALVCEVMGALRIGLPKIMVSTMASGDVSPYVGDSDICMMPSIVDISGTLNAISKRILSNAAAAMAGMSSQYHKFSSSQTAADESVRLQDRRRTVAVTMFGLTTPGVTAACELLQGMQDEDDAGALYDPVVFHATGSGGRCMERLIDEGWFDAVLDMTTTELADEECGGVLSAGPSRLTAAGKARIPQVVSLGALDMCNFGPRASVPERYASRTLHIHNPSVTLMRTSSSECARIGRTIASRLRQSARPELSCVVVPLRGWSGIDVEEEGGGGGGGGGRGPFWDPEADAALVHALRTGLEGSGVEVVLVDGHVNDRETARVMVDRLHALLRRSSETETET